MKKALNLLALLMLFTTATFTSCAPEEEDPEETTPADARDRFVGSYNCQENISGQPPANFTVHINKSTANSNDIWIENIYGLGFSNKATAMTSSNNFTIASQTISGNIVQGSGTLVGTTTINMSYTVNNGSSIDSCTAVLTKQ